MYYACDQMVRLGSTNYLQNMAGRTSVEINHGTTTKKRTSRKQLWRQNNPKLQKHCADSMGHQHFAQDTRHFGGAHLELPVLARLQNCIDVNPQNFKQCCTKKPISHQNLDLLFFAKMSASFNDMLQINFPDPTTFWSVFDQLSNCLCNSFHSSSLID